MTGQIPPDTRRTEERGQAYRERAPRAGRMTAPQAPHGGPAAHSTADALFSDAASATATPLPAPRLRPPLETLTWQEPPTATEESAS